MSDQTGVDVLMITYNRPYYTRLSLKQLLESADTGTRVWIWHNGNDPETLEIVRDYSSHKRVHAFHHNETNEKLWGPTNWFWERARGALVGKVDDDCLVPRNWIEVLRKAHKDAPEAGVLGCWRFFEEDYMPKIAAKKTLALSGGHQLLVNCWVEGSGYLMKRECLESCGLLRVNEDFTKYCLRVALAGWVNGWYFPFLYQEHMDDPRSENTLLRSDSDFPRYAPLTAKNFGASNLAEWLDVIKADARIVQNASPNPKRHIGWQARIGRFKRHLLGQSLRPSRKWRRFTSTVLPRLYGS